MKQYEVYKITNIDNKKIYIGYTNKGIENRLHKHYTNAMYGIDTHFYRAIRKYGIDKFKYKSIDKAKNISEIKTKEIYWIKYYDTYKNGYNMTCGGDGGDIINQLSPEKYQQFIDKKTEQATGENNPRYSGLTDEEIVNYGVECFIENNFNWILKKWHIDYCNKFSIPKSFSKFRFNNLGVKEFKRLMIIKLNQLGYNIIEIKYKQTLEHKQNTKNKNTSWYHNDILCINKQLKKSEATNSWVPGRKKYKKI